MSRESYLALVRGERRGLGPNLARLGLGCVSLPYGLGVALRNIAYGRGWTKTHPAGVPVISVGNLTLGGTGKTPCVEWLANWCRGRDLRAAILSRGYGALAGRNDEALVLEENCPDVPHLQGADRRALATIAVEELESEVLILDDGFQHRRLGRDLDVVLVDATCPWGHGWLFPRGLLREPASSLGRADVVLLTRCDMTSPAALSRLHEEVRRHAPGAPIAESEHRPAAWVNGAKSLPADAFASRPVAAFCGLGNPDAFRRTLVSLGAEPIAWRTYPDHHAYSAADVEELSLWARALPPDAVIATTQKDLVKLRLDLLGERELWALRIVLHLRAGAEELTRKLETIAVRTEDTERSSPCATFLHQPEA
ncbi:MAG TPA: tetraacyldisaccharide 4'-kinase [Gemmataceae bacterium]|jgi:tetraacyldisaccharide 4'-kinase|nr:tetraacyldisaccharide 4'-kinase [Gemmataceae bacterium]